jgi:acetylglutamate kinase
MITGSRLLVVKIGGSTITDIDTTLKDLVTLQRNGYAIVVVHGGGNVISQWMQRQGSVPRFLRGRRVTDANDMETVIAVLAGLVNKQIVASLISMGAKTVGFTGVDGGMLQAHISDPEMGLVGDITRVDPELLLHSLESGYMPVIAPLGFHFDHTSREAPAILNINGDTVAGELAVAVGAHGVIFLTDVDGVMDLSSRVIPKLTIGQAELLLSNGVVHGGMIPKIQACLRAMEQVNQAHVIDGRKSGALIDCIYGKAQGTIIQA